jgi:VWFA-related protein
VIKVRTDLVTVQVAVESGGVPVTNLTASDFEVTDDRVPQSIDMLDAGDVPVDLSIVLDTSGSMRRAVEGLKSDTQAIAAMLQPHDRFRLITFARGATEVFRFQAPSAEVDVTRVSAVGGTALFDAVALAMITPRELDHRHLVVVLTDGEDNSSVLRSDALENLSKHTDAVLYAAVIPPLPGPGASRPTPQPLTPPGIDFRTYQPPTARHAEWNPYMLRPGDDRPLRLAVENTGGIWHQVRTIERAPAGVKQALDWFRSAYILRYRATGVPAAGWHSIDVAVKRQGNYTVRARKGYFWN